MTTSTFSILGGASRMTFARARLLLGISGVGASVIMAASLLLFVIPGSALSTSPEQPLLRAVVSVALVMMVGIAAFLPFDMLGGAALVRQRAPLPVFLARWVRGATVQLVVWMLCAAILMISARTRGVIGAIGSFVLLQFVLAALRAPFARLIADLHEREIPDTLRIASQRAKIDLDQLLVLDSADEAFVGGWTGVWARRLVIPARWLQLPEHALVAALYRRRIIAESGAHLRGVLGAIAWNTLGLALVLALTGADVGTAAGMLTMAAGMTLWAFVGVLLLPTPSRAAVFAVDAVTAHKVGTSAVREAIDRLDRWQDDEPQRSVRVETIFHPVPSRNARHARLITLAPTDGTPVVRTMHAHHLARHALWLGWASLSPISRAVHCNVGRPSLWAMFPGD